MSSMSNHIFFKAKFSITAQEKGVDLLWQIVLGVKAWLTKKCSRNGCTIDNSNVTWSNIKARNGQIKSTIEEGKNLEYQVFLKSAYFQNPKTGFENWACAIYESPSVTQGYCQRQWTTEIGFEQMAIDTAVVSCVISYRDLPFLAKIEAAPNASVPGFLL